MSPVLIDIRRVENDIEELFHGGFYTQEAQAVWTGCNDSLLGGGTADRAIRQTLMQERQMARVPACSFL